MDCNEFDKMYYLIIAVIFCVYVHYVKHAFNVKCCLNKKEVKKINSIDESLV